MSGKNCSAEWASDDEAAKPTTVGVLGSVGRGGDVLGVSRERSICEQAPLPGDVFLRFAALMIYSVSLYRWLTYK